MDFLLHKGTYFTLFVRETHFCLNAKLYYAQRGVVMAQSLNQQVSSPNFE